MPLDRDVRYVSHRKREFILRLHLENITSEIISEEISQIGICHRDAPRQTVRKTASVVSDEFCGESSRSGPALVKLCGSRRLLDSYGLGDAANAKRVKIRPHDADGSL